MTERCLELESYDKNARFALRVRVSL